MKQTIAQFIKNNIFILDGATGTELQKVGMKGSPEQWILENPQALIDLQRRYIASGSHAVLAPTFGANRIKLANYGLENTVAELNKNLVAVSRKAVGKKAFVLADIASTGKFVEPFGDLAFEDCVNVYKEQVQALLKTDIDGFFIETMADIQETRAALLAIKELTDKFTFVSMTYDENGRTLTGTDAVTATLTIQALGADAVGMNCSTGPQHMLPLVKKIKKIAKVPVFVKPNAGMPRLKDGQTVFDMGPKDFIPYLPQFFEAGVNGFGGCCGTTPDHIKVVSKFFKNKKAPLIFKKTDPTALTSNLKTVFIGHDQPFVMIGERINPTGKKLLKEALKNNDLTLVRQYALEQKAAGAQVLDVNVGAPGADEKALMQQALKMLVPMVDTPLCFDSSDPAIFEQALRLYPGRALINSISLEHNKCEKLLPLAKKYGALFILLPLSSAGVPQTAEERIAIAKKIITKAKKYGLDKSSIILDGLVMTISTGTQAAAETLKLMHWATAQGINTTCGLSNVSFGLPNRELLNATFLSLGAANGLTAAIINPNNEALRSAVYAIDALKGLDTNCLNYVQRFANTDTTEKKQTIAQTPEEQLRDCVISGQETRIVEITNQLIAAEAKPAYLLNEILIPAIRKVGELFEKQIYFLPQLMLSAKAMQASCEILEPLLKASGAAAKGTVIVATVKGDIHDIGKNIVALMLRNNGFDVIDLGKDVPAEDIITAAKKHKADLILLSALMTTTMTEMPKVIELASVEKLPVKFMVGGAVVDKSYADEIKADGYSKDAAQAVELATKLLGK